MLTMVNCCSLNPLSSKPGPFEFPALSPNKGSGMGIRDSWCQTEMFASFPCVTRSLDENRLLSLRGSECQLIQGDALSSSSKDPGSGRFGELQSADWHLGHLIFPHVISDGSHYNCDLPRVSLSGQLALQPTDGYRWSVDFAHEKSLQDDLVEFGVGSPGQVSIELLIIFN